MRGDVGWSAVVAVVMECGFVAERVVRCLCYYVGPVADVD